MQNMPLVLEWVMAAAAVWNTLFVHPVMKESKIVCFPPTDRSSASGAQRPIRPLETTAAHIPLHATRYCESKMTEIEFGCDRLILTLTQIY